MGKFIKPSPQMNLGKGHVLYIDELTVDDMQINGTTMSQLEAAAKATACKAWMDAHGGDLTGFEDDWNNTQWPAIVARMAK